MAQDNGRPRRSSAKRELPGQGDRKFPEQQDTRLPPPGEALPKPTMFIGSSSEGLLVAEAMSERLKNTAEITVWNEGVFDLNKGTLEELINAVSEFDFAVLVLSPDDITESRDQRKASARDNVLFESGLFIGSLGRERTFLVHDGSRRDLKIPSDLAGVTLATYDGDRMANNPFAAVRGACSRIETAMKKSEYIRAYRLMGEWKSRYWITSITRQRQVDEDVTIRPRGGRIFFTNTNNPSGDTYEAYARLVRDRYVIGDWKSTRPSANANGAFMLTINPLGTLMYGYFSGPEDDGGVVFSYWILARKERVLGDLKPAVAARKAQQELELRLKEGCAAVQSRFRGLSPPGEANPAGRKGGRPDEGQAKAQKKTNRRRPTRGR